MMPLGKHLLYLLLFSIFSCSVKEPEDGITHIRVLTYSSLTGESSLAASIEKLWTKKFPEQKISFVHNKSAGGILAQIKLEKRRRNLRNIDFVLGINSYDLSEIIAEKEIAESFHYASSPYSILANTKLAPEHIRSFKELLASPLKKSLILQDPRSSNPGKGWVEYIYSNKINLQRIKELSFKSFPSWTDSFQSFTQGDAPFIWTYASSEAYFHCKKNYQYRSIQVPNAPVEKEWLLSFNHSNKTQFLELKKILMTHSIQKDIAQKNWMIPLQIEHLPKCFREKIKTFDVNKKLLPRGRMKEWIKEWENDF